MSRDPIYEGGGVNHFQFAANNPASVVDPSGLAPIAHFYDPVQFLNLTGVPPSFWGNPGGQGCRSVVDFYLDLPQTGFPEDAPNTTCWNGGLSSNLLDIVKHKCPCNTTPVLWTKQWSGGQNTPDHGPVDTSNPGWSGPRQPDGAGVGYDYGVFAPRLGQWVGDRTNYSQSISGRSIPWRRRLAQITCVTCKPNKK